MGGLEGFRWPPHLREEAAEVGQRGGEVGFVGGGGLSEAMPGCVSVLCCCEGAITAGGVGRGVGAQVQLSDLRVEGDWSRVVGQLRRDDGRDVGPAVQDGSAGGRKLPGLVGHQPDEHDGEP